MCKLISIYRKIAIGDAVTLYREKVIIR